MATRWLVQIITVIIIFNEIGAEMHFSNILFIFKTCVYGKQSKA